MKITLGVHPLDLTYPIIKALCIAIVNMLRGVTLQIQNMP